MSSEHLGIVELHATCRSLSATHDVLFRTLGGWVTSTTEPTAQQLFAEACHRHAWHAELWRDRTPAIPVDDAAGRPGPLPLALDPDVSDRVLGYRTMLAGLAEATEMLAARADPVLDPATRRVAALTLADLTALARRADAIA